MKSDDTNTQHYTVRYTEQTDVIIESGLLERLPHFLAPYNHTAYFIICDSTTKKLFGNKIIEMLSVLDRPVRSSTIESGEQSKSLLVVMNILSSMHTYRLDRKSAVIALGGGVVGDIATVVSGLYYRGVDCIQIPTTLLSQVDSGLGGKGAVDMGFHKNTVGIIRQPRSVLIDPSLIFQLPPKQVISGMGEIVKYAVSLDKELFEKLEKAKNLKFPPSSKDQADDEWDWVIKRCIKLKMSIVEQDPEDITGIRAALNFGHTLGQAIELTMPITHGEAIGIGMAYAMKMSIKLGILDKEDNNRALKLMGKFNLPITMKRSPVKDILYHMKKDKKTIGGRYNFVLLKGIGQAITNQQVNPEVVEESLQEIMQ